MRNFADENMLVTRLGHSGFAIESADGGVTVIVDYYTDTAGVLPAILRRARRLYVLVSHSHRDHLNPDIFGWRSLADESRTVQYVIAGECRRKLKRSMPVEQWPMAFLRHDEEWHDDCVCVEAFDSTDVGVSFLIHVDGHDVFHAGDFTCWHFSDENDAQAVRKAVGDYHAVLRKIASRVSHVDLALFPVVPNIGGDWAYGPRQFLATIAADVCVPMHTWGRDREACRFELYRNPAHGGCRWLDDGETLTL